MKKWLFLVFFVPFFAFGKEDTLRKYPYVLSIPKSGGHMVLKMMHLFPEKPVCHWSDHILSFGLRNPLYYDSKVVKILLVRDLRDVFVSLVYWFDRQVDEGLIKRHLAAKRKGIDDLIKEWKELNFDEKLTRVLKDEEGTLYYNGFMMENIREACNLLEVKNTHLFHYEDLVGLKGGGTQEAQLDAILEFASIFSIELSVKEAEKIGEDMYGNSYPSDGPFGKGRLARGKSTIMKRILNSSLSDIAPTKQP